MFIYQALWLAFSLFTYVQAARNVSVSHSDSAIVYSPLSSWSRAGDGEDGGHMLTEDPTATATFTFQGVAIYFASPLWPYTVNTAVSLDSSAPVLLDLTDHDASTPGSEDGAATVRSHPIRGFTNLVNTQHTFVVSVGAGQPFAIVDALIYTVAEDDDEATTTSTSSHISPPTATSKSSPAPTSTSDATASGALASNGLTSTEKIVIAVFSIVGALFVTFVIWKLWHLCRRSKRWD
ncbi:hypothetical protein DXG03_002719 [Asterophora parasitica]|uniref:Uncharacterized protein n=1 Tax=Asterophora parasitica TaxID=117018 RepID=A0A9P7KB30_9AGAR|nr:hypothetical protein DXG03_002719 [Asterophora parasitica]